MGALTNLEFTTKHGLQSLGKATAVVRRMPPPATLPSLKAEHGQDPTIAIVPQGGTGWIRSSEDSSNKQNGSSSDNANAPDLRPTWAKAPSGSNLEQSSQGNAQIQGNQAQGNAPQVASGQTPPNNRDFPSLAASVAAAGKDTSPLKPQKTNAWGTNLEDAQVEIPPIPVTVQQSSTGGYIGASTAPKSNVDRKLPERYFSSTTSVATVPRPGKTNFREKLARLSIDSKEQSMEEMKQPEKEPSPPLVQQISQQPQGNQVNMNQGQNQQRSSQDVRQIHGQQQMEHQQQEWQQGQEGYYEYDRHHMPGRGEGGYDRRYQRQGFQRFDEPIRQQQYRQENVNMDEVGWNQDEIRGPPNQNIRQNSQGNRYRMDSRSSNEADSNWQNYRQNRIPGWYENSGYPMQHEFQGNHNFQQNQNFRGQDYRRQQQGHDCDYGTYSEGQNFHKNENHGYRNPMQGPQRVQQPEMPYRMLKRNDEKSAEYIAHHGGAVIPQNPQGEEVQKKPKEQKQKNSKKIDEEQEAETANRYQQELDYNFPSIDQNLSEQQMNEWGSEPYGNSNQRRSQRKGVQKPKGESSSDAIGSNHWVQQQTGPSWDDLTIPTDHRGKDAQNDEGDDDVYTGTKREFVNSKRMRNPYKNEQSTRGKGTRVTVPRAPVQGQNGKKLPAKSFEGKKRHEDNFSNMGEFHVDDYRTPEELAPQRHSRHRDSDSGTHDDNSFDGSRRGSKRNLKPQRTWKKNPDDQEHENGDADYNKSKKMISGSSTRGGTRFLRGQKPVKQREDRKQKSLTDRSIGVKSPAISEGIDDEWETASESSDFADRIKEEKAVKTEKKVMNNNKKAKVNGTSEEDKQADQKTTRQKNVKPASHTFQDNNASGKNNGGCSKSSNGSSNSHQLLLNKKDAKDVSSVNARDGRKAQEKSDLEGISISNEDMNFQQESSGNVEPDLGTSVWNSVRVIPAANTVVVEEKQRPHIPSPIARPMKTQSTSGSNSINMEVSAVKEEYSAFGVTTVNTSTGLYDIQSFDPKTSPIGTKPIKSVQKAETEGVLNSDHAVLKEKLDKVKDFWQGEENNHGNQEKTIPNLSQAHGPNVAKVKPQPQLQDQQQPEKTKQNVESCIFQIPQAQSPNLYHPNQMFTMGQTNGFGQMQNPNYQIIYGTSEFMQYGGHQSSPPSHSVFGGQLGLLNQQQGNNRHQNSYDGGAVFGLWSSNMDFLSNNMNQNQGNRFQQQYNSNSRPNSGPGNNIHPTNIPPPSMSFNQQGQLGTFVPTHIPPPQISQHYTIGPFTTAPNPAVGNNRGNGNRFPIQQNANFRQQIPPQGPPQQFGFQPMNRPGSGSNQRNNSGFPNNPQNQRGSPNWQKNNQQNYGGYFNVKYGANQSTA
ncbi:hypothetical protein FO519_004811 [Halicephalobus sp. NKZ332]|nr:hypothetical protein FO519_004811 [Halicephalobus sp. NKZ332]